MSTAIDPALVQRFSEALERLNPDGGRIGLAVSGGPDSMAMLLLAQEAMPGGFEVATVNHGLRAEAAAECALVVEACEARGVRCEVLTVEVGAGNLQSEAREARYRALGDWARMRGIRAVATAHHADDQAETLLMRLNRGSGVAGLAGVRETQRHDGAGVTVIRPLLGFRRSDLQQIVAAAGQPAVADPSNLDERYDRVRMRQALAGCDWLDPVAVARSARHLSDAFEALQDYAAQLWPRMVTETSNGCAITPGPSREMNRRVLAMALEKLGRRPRGGDVARLLEQLERGGGGNVAGVLARAQGKQWVLRPEPPRKTG